MTEPTADGTGLLLAMMEPSPTLEEEFQDWYDSEHFPERQGTEGFLTAHRLICVDGWPRYLALYDLTDREVLDGAGYAKIAGGNYSLWTHRIIPKVWGHYRAAATQIYPGRALFGDRGRAARIALWRFRGVTDAVAPRIVDGLRSVYEDRAETAQLRIFVDDKQNGTDAIAIVELHAPFVPPDGAIAALGEARKHVDLVNAYTSYFRS